MVLSERRPKRPLRVFYMVYSLTSGGIEKYSVNLLKHIDKQKFSLDFITKIDRKEFFDDQVASLGGKKIPLSSEKSSGVREMFELFWNAYKTARRGYDLAYFNLSTPAAVFKYPLICKLAGIHKIVIHSHNASEDGAGIGHSVVNYLGRAVINRISSERFACSDKAAQWMFGGKVAEQGQYTLIQNGIETVKYTYNKEKREKIRKELNIGRDHLVLGHVGRFAEQKNHEFLIAIMKEISKIDTKAVLLLIGVGEKFGSIQSLVHEYGLNDRVRFMGETDRVADLMQAMDVFVLPSHFEGLPVVGIEAQASGLKCVLSSNISLEADVTGNVSFLDLNLGPKKWANFIDEVRGYQRQDTSKAICDAQYDIRETTRLVEKKLTEVSRF
ncbi:Putative glycosyltransferase EpsF [Lactiplantibacillus plantarum]|uniref:glycosyltransferase n=1 Tax=Lactobacillaceae TaxID=33958 RepID=UPI000975CC76|nr:MULTISPECIES: glycosyltransferase [Lactobacillaceae]MCJ8189536.1 glycosyltransferase [Lactiplantibacillus pentosus]PKX65614.1 glycosyltransferase family 1 protein [Lactiplantibacillus plantarum]VFI64123.1 Putative glycosyltransferase EpsF [Lactiplantibacillus plantarum]VFI64158.1 Putative glycosyltransferase EpsF [Lactiplantibacillus plantarum]